MGTWAEMVIVFDSLMTSNRLLGLYTYQEVENDPPGMI